MCGRDWRLVGCDVHFCDEKLKSLGKAVVVCSGFSYVKYSTGYSFLILILNNDLQTQENDNNISD